MGSRVRIVHGNALDASLSDATVVFLYLLPAGNARLAAKLEAELPRGARVVTHMFRMPPAWEARAAGVRAVGACRPGGVDTSAFTKLYLYDMRDAEEAGSGGGSAAAAAGEERAPAEEGGG